MDFYAYLPSNASPEIYPDNKTSQFKIEFCKRLELFERWEVALMELAYPNTIFNVRDGHNYIKVFNPLSHNTHLTSPETKGVSYEVTGASDDVTFRSVEQTFIVPAGYYASQDLFLAALHESLKSLERKRPNDVPQSIMGISEEGFFEIVHSKAHPGLTFEFAPTLAHQLGLPSPGPFRHMRGTTYIDLSLGVPSQLFLYCDLISDQITGHMRAPLLRTVPTNIEAKFGSTTYYHCEHPIYFDLKTKSFDSVEINIRDDSGKLVPFVYGTSNALVHFKQSS